MAAHIIRGMHPWDRDLFLKLCGTLGMAATKLLQAGYNADETKPYFDMLEQAKKRFGSGPVEPVHLIRQEPPNITWCGEKIGSLTSEPDECTCLTCMRAALTSRLHENPLGLTVGDPSDTIVN